MGTGFVIKPTIIRNIIEDEDPVVTRYSGQLPGSFTQRSADLPGTGNIRIIQFWGRYNTITIYTDDFGLSWKRFNDGAAVSFPLTIDNMQWMEGGSTSVVVYEIDGHSISYISYDRENTHILQYALLQQAV